MLEKLSFEIQESPVLYSVDGVTLTNTTHKVISKTGSNSPLSVMKNSYKPMLNEDFMETTNRMQEISGFEFSGYSEFDNGRIVISHLKNTLKDFSINGHLIRDYLMMMSSFDGRYSFCVGTTTLLIRCMNQFSSITQAEKVRHTKSAPKKREELMNSLQVYFSSRQMMYNQFNEMTRVKVDPLVRQMAIDYILQITKEDHLEHKISTRKANIMKILNKSIDFEMGELGQNMWGFFQGVTKYTTHERTQKESVFGNMIGSGALINERAYNFALQYV